MRIAVYPGTFDPFTLGHINLVERALTLFDKVIVAIARSSAKYPMFNLEERIAMVGEIFTDTSRVQACGFSGLLYQFAAEKDARILLRGVRSTTDFEYELQLANMNRNLMPDLETVFLTPDLNLSHISSTLVREIGSMGGDISTLVSANVLAQMQQKIRKD